LKVTLFVLPRISTTIWVTPWKVGGVCPFHSTVKLPAPSSEIVASLGKFPGLLVTTSRTEPTRAVAPPVRGGVGGPWGMRNGSGWARPIPELEGNAWAPESSALDSNTSSRSRVRWECRMVIESSVEALPSGRKRG
jgi:hypothetical protein